MKKFNTILIVILALFCGVIFSACKNSYKFNVKFYLEDSQISQLNLYIDENDTTATQHLSVKFSHIKSSKIGPIEITIDQMGVASISTPVKSGTTFNFDVTALAPTSDANLIVRHLSSNKTAQIKLNIQKRSSKVVNLNKTYVVEIPSEGVKTSYINTKQLLNYNGTERVYFALANNSTLPAGITPVYEEVEGKSVIAGFNVPSQTVATSQDSSDVLLNPVFYIPNYYNQTQTDMVIHLKFLNLLSKDKINLQINNSAQNYKSDAYQTLYEQNKPIMLLYNDENFKTITAKFSFNAALTDYNKYYKAPTLVANNGQNANSFSLAPAGEDNSYNISAQSVADASVINFVFNPNEQYVGDIVPFNTGIQLSSSKRATDVEVRMDDSAVADEDLNYINIFDKYYDASYGEKLGAKFNFVPQNGAIEEFDFMRITIPMGMLFNENNIYSQHEFDLIGNETFSGLIESDDRLQTNNNLLQIYLKNQPMRFYLDSYLGRLVSEVYSRDDNIFIKYCKNTSGGNADTLNMSVENVYKYMGSSYDAGYAYFNNSSAISSCNITFSAQEGVQSVIIKAGFSSNGLVTFYDGDVNQISIARSDERQYALKINSVLGGLGAPILNTKFNVSILPKNDQDNLVKLKIGDNGEEKTQLEYNYTSASASDTRQFLYLSLSGADLGYYNLTISHANGYTLTIPLFVYDEVSASDLSYTLQTTSGLDFANEDENYLADYLVPADENRKLGLFIENNNKLGLKLNLDQTSQPFYSFQLDFGMEYSSHEVPTTNRQARDFVTTQNFSNQDMQDYNSAFGNFITFKTNANGEAGYFENGKNYVIATIKIKRNFSFDNIISNPVAQSEYTQQKQIRFYIYKKFNKNLLTLQFSNRDIFFNDYLAYGLQEQSTTDLTLSYQADADIWNYVDEVVWSCDREVEQGTSYQLTNTNNNSIQIQFLQHTLNNYFTFIATITQFGVSSSVASSIQVKTPVVTTDLLVDDVSYDYNGNFYIDIQAGKSLTLGYQLSANGQITNPGVFIYVVNRSYNTGSTQYEVSLNRESVYIDGNRINAISSEQNLSLIVVASDVLSADLAGNYADLNQITSKFLNPNNEDISPYLNAYKIIDLHITDGNSEQTAFIIDSVQDFEGINDYANQEKYFVLLNNLNLSSISAPITHFKGHLFSLNGYNFSLAELTLSASLPYLFESILEGASVKNINIQANFNYNNLSNLNLGVIAENAGELTDVTINFAGSAVLNRSANFGALVGENRGTITYTSARTAASGNISLSGGGQAVFGGLVGLNSGSVTGYKYQPQQSESYVVFADGLYNGATADISITSSLSNADSAVGGLVGKNTGKINQVLVCGTINATNNVGGIIGINQLSEKSAQITYNRTSEGNHISNISFEPNEFEVQNAISQVIIVGSQNVGGVVGRDRFGRYYNCAYQIYQPNKVAVSGSTNVGGFAGQSADGWFNYCYVYSYRWNYASLSNIGSTSENPADITGANNVGGLVGQGSSSWSEPVPDIANTTAALIIANCSVNAYVGALDANTLTAGLINIQTDANQQHSAITNAYFLGRLSGKIVSDNHSLALTNIADTANLLPFYGDVYSKYFNQSTTTSGNYPTEFNPDTASGDVWDIDNSGETNDGRINGGNAYLKFNGKPLFELAPTSVSASAIEKENIFGAYKLDDHTIYLNYYNFNLDANEPNYQDIYNRLQEQYNTYNILELFNLTCLPSNIKVLQLTTNSTGNCIYIQNEKLIVRGVGQAQVTFTSLINPNAQDSVKIIVGYPFGNSFMLKESTTAIGELENFGVGRNQTKEVTVSFSGNLGLSDHNNKKYSYQTNSEVKYIVVASLIEGATDSEFEDFVANSLFIGGKNLIKEGGTWTANVSNLTINVKADFKGIINIKVQPYIEISSYNKQIIYSTTKQFNLTTLIGARAVEMQTRGGWVYPNTSLTKENSFEVDILTDFAYTEDQLDFALDSELKIYISIDGERINIGNIKDIIDFELDSLGNKLISYDDSLQKQTIKFKIKFAKFEDIIAEYNLDKSAAHILLFEFEINNKMGWVAFNLAPQQIFDVNLRNYVVENNELVESPLLYRGKSGVVIIDMYPKNGYFDFLEIRDITPNADTLIQFIQVNHNLVKDNVNIGDDIETEDGLGIELNKNAFNADDNKIYALTQILNNQLEIDHQIEVIAYVGSRENKLKVGRSVLELTIRLQPELEVDYLKPDGSKYISVDESKQMDSNEIAYGTNVDFRTITQYVDGLRAEISFTSDYGLGDVNQYFNLVQLNNGYFRLNSILRDERLINKEITLKFTGVRATNTGEEITTERSFNLKIARLKVFNVSIRQNSHMVGDSLEVYGNFNIPIDLEFYFAPTDVSYYMYPNTEFRFNSQFNDDGATSLVNILKTLNGFNGDEFDVTSILSWYGQKQGETVKVNEDELIEGGEYGVVVSRSGTTPPQITVKSNYTISYLQLKFNLVDDSNYNKMVAALSEEDSVAEFVIIARLNFQRITPVFDAILIKNNADLLNMAGAESRYILGCDLTFDENNPYTPFDLDVASFDGNGHTINISAFNLLDGNTINAGLFTSISATSVVQNVQVNYNLGKISVGRQLFSTESVALGNPNGNYDAINFGGIAVQNHGVITNCKVVGSTIFSQANINIAAVIKQDNKNISPFNIGGVAYINDSNAFITNTISELKIAAMANTGALVHTNNGTITSSYYNAMDEAGLMYMYQTEQIDDGSGNTIALDANSAGFVLNNNGRIDMCYVISGKTTFDNGNIGNLSANNDFAGFVYNNNNASITNCYTNVELMGRSESQFAGFVIDNRNGTIQNCYSYINQGENLDRRYLAFVPAANDGELINCYTIRNNGARPEYDSNKVTTINKNELYGSQADASFAGFSFGDHKSGIWQMQFNVIALPQLSATLETIPFTQQDEPDILETVTHYYGWKDIDLYEDGSNEIIVKNDGSEKNPYVIYDIQTWNAYFESDNYKNGYYRLVADINFNGTAPYTSGVEFSGNIQGNGLTISNFALSTEQDLNSIGLFSALNGEYNNYDNNAIRNLNIKDVSISAIKTQSVGVLAGVISNYKLYNITLDSTQILLGENVVGGLSGIISNRFDIEHISSNISAHNDFAVKPGNYEVYTSRINGLTQNLNRVYYAGSVAGIVDAIPVGTTFDITSRNTTDGYSIRDISVAGDITLISNTVGGAFGLINEYTNLTDVIVNLTEGTGKLAGYQYSAGVVGENRGVIKGATFESANDQVFNSARATAAGLVGLNLGYIKNASTKFNAIRTNFENNNYRNVNTILAGLVGRNAEGYIVDSSFDGKIISAWSNPNEVTAGIIGTDYTLSSFVGENENQQVNNSVFSPYSKFTYNDPDTTLNSHIINVSVSKNAVDFWLDNLNYIYDVKSVSEQNPFEIKTGRVLAAGIGLKLTNDSYPSYSDNNYNFGFDSNYNFVMNATLEVTMPQFGALQNITMYNDEVCSTPYANIFNYTTKDNKVYILNALGSYVLSFDYFEANSYTCEMMILANNLDIKKISIKAVVENTETQVQETKDVIIYKIATTLVSTSDWTFVIYSNLSEYKGASYQTSVDLFFVGSITDENISGATINKNQSSGTTYVFDEQKGEDPNITSNITITTTSGTIINFRFM